MRLASTPNMGSIRVVTLTGMLLLEGCMTVGPDFEKPEVMVADSWLEAVNENMDTSSSNDQKWWEVFEEPVLSNLIDNMQMRTDWGELLTNTEQ